MTFLSRLELESRDLAVARDVADVGQLHRTIMRGFPQTDDPRPRAAFDVLFRLETSDARRVVLAQSNVEPDWSLLPAGYLRHAECKPIGDALSAITIGRELRFLLVANPTKKVSSEARNSRRVELTTDDARHAWLERRAARDGFRLDQQLAHGGVRIDRLPDPVGRRGRTEVTVKRVRFEGRLVVEDAERFVVAIRTGVGPAKAYGCGLLSVAPV